ncbi:hypothetical protein [Arthrobacter cryoconiti]|uniref:ATP/GTP-binding protein n=1 Tax=Arthrobacter cryoconiti TaxID=748907 RepID=A0ABV8QXH1_9MICC|nr:hypothetical protein [Arthrobacter cryoconiti]MCC9068918.1 hypothetical protein [Arthrobacter cryoconiti]
MPRSNHPRRRRTPVAGGKRSPDGQEVDLSRARMGLPEHESAPDGEWIVRTISRGNALKVYTCPGCNHSVQAGMAHLVVWREDAMFGAEAGLRERRHWHGNCWRGRSYRYR